MSIGKRSSPSRRDDAEKVEEEVEGGRNGGGDVVQESAGGKKKAADQRRYGRCFSGLELNVGPGPLKDVDAGKLKGHIRKWARAVVAYARQLSFGSPRSSSSPSMASDGATPRSKSGLGSARGDDRPSPSSAATVN